MSSIGKQTTDRRVIWHDSAVFPRFEPRLFDPDWVRVEGHHRGCSTGRNEAHFLSFQGTDMVLRHYYRGGLIGRLIKDRFLRQPVAQSRAMQEFTLLSWMYEQGLPVPRPIAARFTPHGAWYSADLLTQTLPDTATLADLLRDRALDKATWGRIGATIARMHRAGVFHSDLNCRNILLDGAGAVWLIDFDKCERRAPGDWTQANLARLHRSFTKEKTKVPGLHWDETGWNALVAGYNMTMRDGG